MTIFGERKSEAGKCEGESFRRERFFGTFSRSVTLSSPVESDEVKAAYQDGILTVTLPKAEEAKPKKISARIEQGLLVVHLPKAETVKPRKVTVA